MSLFKIFKDVEVRFADIDVLGHVNNAVYLSYMEEARLEYMNHVFPGYLAQQSFQDFPFIVGDAYCRFLKPAVLGQTLRLHVGVTEMGTKSLKMSCDITDKASGELVAQGYTTIITYNQKSGVSYPIPEEARQRMRHIEGREIPAKPK